MPVEGPACWSRIGDPRGIRTPVTAVKGPNAAQGNSQCLALSRCNYGLSGSCRGPWVPSNSGWISPTIGIESAQEGTSGDRSEPIRLATPRVLAGHRDRIAPGGRLRGIDLAQIQDVPLYHPAMIETLVLDDAPVVVRLADFLSLAAPQKHDGPSLSTRLQPCESGRSSLEPFLAISAKPLVTNSMRQQNPKSQKRHFQGRTREDGLSKHLDAYK